MATVITGTLPAQVEFFDGGAILHAPHRGGQRGSPKAGKGSSKRGKVSTWSRASRSRMRQFCIQHEAIDGYRYIGATFTIPGPVVTWEDAKNMLNMWSRSLVRKEWGALWRMEVQRRGQIHYHLLVVCPRHVAAHAVKQSWDTILSKSGKRRFDPPYVTKTFTIESVSNLLEIPGARNHAAECELMEESDKCMWYLLDHASKRKQHQIADSSGRHWGVIGRKYWQQIESAGGTVLTLKAWNRVIRTIRRWHTPQVPMIHNLDGCKGRIPGNMWMRTKRGRLLRLQERKLGYSVKRGSFGKSVWFTDALKLAHVVAWAEDSE